VGGVITSTVAGSGALALFAKSLYALPFGGVLLVVEGVIWFCWRKDAVIADMRRTTRDMDHTAEQLEALSNRTAHVVERLGTTGGALHEDRVALEREGEVVSQEVKLLQEQLHLLQQDLERYKSENSDLKTHVEDLQKNLDRMKRIVQQFSDVLKQKGKLQEEFAEKLRQGKENVAELAVVGRTLTVDIAKIDTSWDENVENFKKSIEGFDASGKQLLEQVAGELQRFATEVSQADRIEATLQKDVENLQRALEELKRVLQLAPPLERSSTATEGWQVILDTNRKVIEFLKRGLDAATRQPGPPSDAGGQ
jgi:chromosome segregation ATPase